MTAIHHTARELQRSLSAASDEQLKRVVALLDDMPSRGDADQVLSGLRGRVGQLGLKRPLRFPRLLFKPLDPVIRNHQSWKPEDAAVPRSAILPIAQAVQAALGEAGAAIAAEADGVAQDDIDAVAELGERLWPEAAEALAEQPPPGWREAGLQPEHYAAIAKLCRHVWRHGRFLWAAMSNGRQGPTEEQLRWALDGPSRDGADAFAAAMAVLLPANPAPGTLLRLAFDVEPKGSRVSIQTLDAVLDSGPSALAVPPNWSVEQRAEATVAAVLNLREAVTALKPRGDDRIRSLERAVDQQCRKEFAETFQHDLMEPLTALNVTDINDADVEELEQAARALKRVEAAGRKLGGAEFYDATFRQVLSQVEDHNTQAREALGRADVLRLVEIIAGSVVAREWMRMGMPDGGIAAAAAAAAAARN